jgi:hypothetical protein
LAVGGWPRKGGRGRWRGRRRAECLATRNSRSEQHEIMLRPPPCLVASWSNPLASPTLVSGTPRGRRCRLRRLRWSCSGRTSSWPSPVPPHPCIPTPPQRAMTAARIMPSRPCLIAALPPGALCSQLRGQIVGRACDRAGQTGHVVLRRNPCSASLLFPPPAPPSTRCSPTTGGLIMYRTDPGRSSGAAGGAEPGRTLGETPIGMRAQASGDWVRQPNRACHVVRTYASFENQ